MNIRKATIDDLDTMQNIFAHARREMIKNNNPNQWKDNRPPLFLIMRDLNNNTSYIIEENGIPYATFSFTIGIEPTYINIENGNWLNDEPYGTIHRIATNNMYPHVFRDVMKFLKDFNIDIRIDTHEDNSIMLHLLEKYNFIKCGIITIDDGTTRIAFQHLKSSNDYL